MLFAAKCIWDLEIVNYMSDLFQLLMSCFSSNLSLVRYFNDKNSDIIFVSFHFSFNNNLLLCINNFCHLLVWWKKKLLIQNSNELLSQLVYERILF